MANQRLLSKFLRHFLIDQPQGVKEINYPSYSAINVATISGGIIHLGCFFVFLLLEITPLMLFNIVSISLYSCAFILNRKGFHFAWFALAIIELCLHQTLCVALIGWGSGFQYWILIIPTCLFIMPSGRILMKITAVVLCCSNFILLDFYFRNVEPMISINPIILNVMNYSNTFLFLGINAIFLFYFAGKMHETKKILRKEQSKVAEAYSMLSKYVAPQLSETISNGQIDSIWKHNRKKLTLFFSDIKDFTKITDALEPEDMASLLNEYLTEMNKIINKYEGTLAQVIGDGLYIFFGAPKSTNDKEHAIRCLKMAIDMQLKMKELNKKWFDIGVDQELQIRCGINTGMATVGGYGSSERKEYTAMGMQVNIAARLESACKPGHILINHTTWVLVKNDIPCLEKGQIDIKGYHLPVRIYEVEATQVN